MSGDNKKLVGNYALDGAELNLSESWLDTAEKKNTCVGYNVKQIMTNMLGHNSGRYIEQ